MFVTAFNLLYSNVEIKDSHQDTLTRSTWNFKIYEFQTLQAMGIFSVWYVQTVKRFENLIHIDRIDDGSLKRDIMILVMNCF
ncbi:hypothetical protein KSF78_0007145 [Schistosoma japonicum]|nr:hypothetical protein KSF78_0007145 [Schistosoma japonicum]